MAYINRSYEDDKVVNSQSGEDSYHAVKVSDIEESIGDKVNCENHLDTEGAIDKGREPENPKRKEFQSDLIYSVDDIPPIHLCMFLGFQQYLTAFGGILGGPLILSKVYCMHGDNEGLSQVIGTTFLVCGISTILQTTFGVRLPIVQGTTAAFFGPIIAVLSLPEWKCPYTDTITDNVTSTLPELGSPDHREMWQQRLRLIQGSMLLASLLQVFLGCSGLVGVMLRFVGPLSVCPTIALIGLSLFEIGAEFASGQWYIALSGSLLLTLFSQYLNRITVPCCQYKKGHGFSMIKMSIFQMFPVLLTILLMWLVCYILTITNALPDKKGEWGYEARTDIKTSALYTAPWFRFPYPGQWGMPTVSVGAVIGMFSAIIASVVESIGDYRSCARLAGAAPPPDHAMNRGIAIEGIGCMINAAFGSGHATTSYSENVASIIITKVGSRMVVFVAGIFMLLFGCLGKFAALFVAVPDPVLGGVFMVSFGMIISVGISNLQHVNLNSSRNLFIIGTSLFAGLTIPRWIFARPGVMNTGSSFADQIFTILLSTSMLVGGVLGFILDNTIPGTAQERGLLMPTETKDKDHDKAMPTKCTTYDLPFAQDYLNQIKCLRWIPFCPSFIPRACWRKRKDKYKVKDVDV